MWIVLKKASRLPVRMIAVSSAVTGIILAASLKLVLVLEPIWSYEGIPYWEYQVCLHCPFVMAFGLLTLGIWFVLRTKQPHAETAGL